MNNHSRHALVGTLAAASISLFGCGSGSSEALVDTSTPTATPVVAAKANGLTINVVDAVTGVTINNPVTITLGGDLAGRVYDSKNNKVTGGKYSSGVVSLYSDASGNLQVAASADGYLAGGTTALVPSGKAVVTVSLVSAATPPATVSSSKQTASTTDGKLSQPLTATVVGSSATAADVKVSIPAQTTLTAADGTALSGPVSVTVANYDLSQTSASSVLPGGFAVTEADGSSHAAAFAAATTIEIKDASGRLATKLDKPVTLRLNIADGTENPKFNRAYATGDSVDVVSYSATGTWTTEGATALKKDSTGLYAEFDVNHLTTFYVGKKKVDDGCNTPLTVNLPNLAGANVALGFAGKKINFYKAVSTAGQTSVKVAGVPVGFPVVFTALFGGTTLSATTSATYSCGDVVTVNAALTAPVVSQDFGARTVCSDGSGTPSAATSLLVSVFDSKGKLANVGVTDGSGSASLGGLTSGASYNYLLSYPDGDLTGKFTAGDSKVSLDIKVKCNSLTGATGASGD